MYGLKSVLTDRVTTSLMLLVLSGCGQGDSPASQIQTDSSGQDDTVQVQVELTPELVNESADATEPELVYAESPSTEPDTQPLVSEEAQQNPPEPADELPLATDVVPEIPSPEIDPVAGSFIANVRSIAHQACLEVSDGSVEPWVELGLGDCMNVAHQRLRFLPVANKIDVFQLRLEHSGLCVVATEEADDSLVETSAISQGSCDLEDPQSRSQFRLLRLADFRYQLVVEQPFETLDIVAEQQEELLLTLRWAEEWDTIDDDHSQRWELLDINGEIPAVPSPAIAGQWSDVIDWPHIPVSVANMPDGRLVTWAAYQGEDFRPRNGQRTLSTIYDPLSGLFTPTDNYANHDMFCSGIALLEDGTVHASGGNPARKDVSLFRPDTGAWESTGSMIYRRWYGTSMMLTDGDVFATHARGAGTRSEVYSTPVGGWHATPGASMATLESEQIAINAAERREDSVDSQWYAFMHVAPNGRVFHAGPTPTMHWFDTRYEGNVEEAGTRAGDDRLRMFGSSVMYDVGKLLITGGNDRRYSPSSSSTTFTIDIAGTAPVVNEITPMNYSRVYHNSVVLPDGQVLVIGGNTSGIAFSDSGTVLTPEVWNPATGIWRSLADIAVPRNYHSVAVLMEDGRVFSGGGGLCGEDCTTNHPDAQIFTPPYLFGPEGFEAARPAIVEAPAQASAGETLNVRSDDEITAFSLIRLSGTTHGINADQRYLRPQFSHEGDDRYLVTLDNNPNVLVPGNYWLFALNENGVPSEAHTINIRNTTRASVPGGFRSRLKSVESGKCIGITGVSGGPNSTLQQFECQDLPELTFDFIPVEGQANTFKLAFVNMGLCLDLQVDADEWAENGTDLVQRSCSTEVEGATQNFRLESQGLGQYLVASVPNNKVLDLRQASHEDGAPIELWESLYFDTQFWTLD